METINTALAGTSDEPGISEYVRGLRRESERQAAELALFPTLRVPEAERTLAQHLECWSIQDQHWRRLVMLGVPGLAADLFAVASLWGLGPDDVPTAEQAAHLRGCVRSLYVSTWKERGPETQEYARAHGFPVMR